MASLSLKHVFKKYPNGFEAVKDFNLEIEDKEFIIFVGPSGCGKSTTLRMIAGLEDISSGELYIDGKLVNDVEPKDRDIAMVFQNYACLLYTSSYNSFDVLEDGYGINLRPLSMFAAQVYEKDPCTLFLPKLLDQNIYDAVDPGLAAKMHKAIAMIQFKLEGQIIMRHPEYGLSLIHI